MSSTSPTKRHVSDSSTSSADSAPPPTAVPYPARDRSKTGVRHQKKKARPAGSEDETVWSPPPASTPSSSPPPANDEVSRPSPDIASSTSQSIAPPPLSALPLLSPWLLQGETDQAPVSESPSGLPSPLPSTPSSSPRAPPSPPHDGTARKQSQLAHEQLLPVQAPPTQSLETRSTRINQDGLGWKYSFLDYEPTWVREPSTEVIESLARKHLSLPPADRCDVIFHAEEGTFHKLFRVIPGGGVGTGYIMRVALPVDPHFLTSSEVATMEYVRSCTTIPMPKIVAYDSSSRNPLGFEWILMESVHGTRLEELWLDLPMATKERVVRQLTRFQAELFTKPRNQIGNLYRDPPSPTPSPTSSPYPIGHIVQRDFFWEQNIHQPVPRGPFKNSYAWFSARLALQRFQYERDLESPDSGEGDRKVASRALSIVQKLLKLLPSVFPPDQPESTFLCNDDLGMDNVLVDEDGVITAVLRWACVSLLPDWRVCELPDLLQSCEREEPPTPGLPRYLDDGTTISQLYWEEMMDYEATLLRPIFLDEMKRQRLEWVKVMRGSELRTDFETAVTCSNELRATRIDAWLDSFANGKPGWSLGREF
ncbi:MAG: hypothetical protein M1826_001370 [Phylliscum demangeonii]|nr:MAG: hypothetical protein M1826_001370 [Phylliscum demangeonii]